MITDKPDWEIDGADWPLREHSRFIETADLAWHVQVLGSGPVLLLLHGSAASSHSWAPAARLLARHFSVVVPDLPGHGFTGTPPGPRLALVPITRALCSLCDTLGRRPVLIAGHSAGAAIAFRFALDADTPPSGVIAFAPSLERVSGELPSHPFLERSSALLTRVAGTFGAALARNTGVVERLLRSTGSAVPAESVACYRALISRRGHTQAVFAFMQHWEPGSLLDELRSFQPPVLLVAGDRDRWIPAGSVDRIAATLPHAGVLHWPDAGHLAHEEHPDRTASVILDFARRTGILPGPGGAGGAGA